MELVRARPGASPMSLSSVRAPEDLSPYRPLPRPRTL